MVPSHSPRQVQALELAGRAFAAGARTSTVAFLTGLDRGALRRYLPFERDKGPKPGKRPDSPERFVKNASASTMVDASLAYVLYDNQRRRGSRPADAVVSAYEHYLHRRGRHGLSLDRMFYMICWTDCLWVWVGREAIFRITTCTSCHCRYLASPAIVDDHERECPFCKVRRRYSRDARLRSHFPEHFHAEVPRVS